MAKKAPRPPQQARLHLIVDLETTARVDEALAALKRLGIYCSVSMFAEIAMRELLERRDLAAVLRKHGATARREPS